MNKKNLIAVFLLILIMLCGVTAYAETNDIDSVYEKGKFCMECGQALINKCPNCGVEVPQGGKFCLECGTKL